METLKEFDQDVAEDSEEKSPAEDDICWDDFSLGGLPTDRCYVEALVEMSAEDSLKEQEPCDLSYSSGWEEAVQGWGRVAALSCMFLPQRKRRKPKTDEQDPHCLLCVDMRPPEALNVDRPPEFGPESHVHPQDRGVNNAKTSDLPTALYRHTAGSSPLQEEPQCLTFSAHQHHILLWDKMADNNTRVQDVLQPSPPSPPHHPHSKPPALKSRNIDLGLPINSFTVLPPLKTPQAKAQRLTHQVCFKESAAGGGSAAGGSCEVGGAVTLSARESRGVERTEDTGGADTVTNTEPFKDTYKPMVPRTAMYCQSQETRQLLNAFTVPVLKGYEVPIGNMSDTHRTTFSIGKHWKQALRTGSEYSRHARSAPPQLPILLGTKVPIVVSGLRPL